MLHQQTINNCRSIHQVDLGLDIDLRHLVLNERRDIGQSRIVIAQEDRKGQGIAFVKTQRLRVMTGLALLDAYALCGQTLYLECARQLAEDIVSNHRHPRGGFVDIAVTGPAYLQVPVTLLTQNVQAATFFVRLPALQCKVAHGAALLSPIPPYSTRRCPCRCLVSNTSV